MPIGVRFPPRRKAGEAYPNGRALIAAVRQGMPDAFEVGLETLSAIAPEMAAELGAVVLALDLWPEAKDRAALALSRSSGRSSFQALLDVVGDVPRAGFLLTQSAFPGGCELVLERLESSPVLRYEPLGTTQPVQPPAFSDVNVARSLIEYLGVRQCARAQGVLARLYAEHPSDKVRLAAGHAMLALGDRSSLDHLTSCGDDRTDAWRLFFAIKATIAKEPATAVERLGGLCAADDAERVRQAFEALKSDATVRRKLGEIPWEERDPAWRHVAEHWLSDRECGASAQALLDRLAPES